MRVTRWLLGLLPLAGLLLAACGGEGAASVPAPQEYQNSQTELALTDVTPTSSVTTLQEGFSTVRLDGETGFAGFLEQGGADSDAEVVAYLAENLLDGLDLGSLLGAVFGCSTISVQSPDGHALFGRNFDWNTCEALVVEAHPADGYASLATVNLDFITQELDGALRTAMELDKIRALAAYYAPLDGMNEAGLAVSVNMIQDSASIDQNTGKPGLTTTTAIRLLLDRAATVEQALELLEQYDLHGSMGMMVHFAIADAGGHSVAVEYVNGEMVVTQTPVLTNFYLAAGEKQGIGTQQSHERYDILTGLLAEHPQLDAAGVRDALDRVSKDNFGEFESTEWSIVFDLTAAEAHYYHREDYTGGYRFRLDASHGNV